MLQQSSISSLTPSCEIKIKANKMHERNKNHWKVKVNPNPQLTSSPPQVVLDGAGGAVVDMNLGWNYISVKRGFFYHLCFTSGVIIYSQMWSLIVLTFSL